MYQRKTKRKQKTKTKQQYLKTRKRKLLTDTKACKNNVWIRKSGKSMDNGNNNNIRINIILFLDVALHLLSHSTGDKTSRRPRQRQDGLVLMILYVSRDNRCTLEVKLVPSFSFLKLTIQQTKVNIFALTLVPQSKTSDLLLIRNLPHLLHQYSVS